jgi:hypothetical protein
VAFRGEGSRSGPTDLGSYGVIASRCWETVVPRSYGLPVQPVNVTYNPMPGVGGLVPARLYLVDRIHVLGPSCMGVGRRSIRSSKRLSACQSGEPVKS